MTMVKMTVLYQQPADAAAFDAYYFDRHLAQGGAEAVDRGIEPLRIELGLAVAGISPDVPAPYYRITNLYFPDLATWEASMAGAAAAEMEADVPNYATGGALCLISEVEPVATIPNPNEAAARDGGLKMTVLYAHPADPVAFDEYYLGHHIAVEAPKLTDVVYAELGVGVCGRAADVPPPFHRITEIYFASRESWLRAMATGGNDEVADDLARYARAGVSITASEVSEYDVEAWPDQDRFSGSRP
jgi:uncharacterized protein (TIGR02118 family)